VLDRTNISENPVFLHHRALMFAIEQMGVEFPL
jgi:hypothetical protein